MRTAKPGREPPATADELHFATVGFHRDRKAIGDDEEALHYFARPARISRAV